MESSDGERMTLEQAVALAESRWWETCSDYDIALFQLHEDRLCLPFERFHEAVEKALGRPVFTHEFGTLGHAGLCRELLGDKPRPSFADILALIPAAKRVVAVPA